MLKDTTDIIRPALDAIAENSDFWALTKGFTYPIALATHAIMFIGLKPSHGMITESSINGYRLKQHGNEDAYFHRYEEISDFCQTPWTYIDLLFDRIASRERIDQLMETETGKQFIAAQLAIADTLIRESKPEVIVICSNEARMLADISDTAHDSRWLRGNLIFDNQIGTPRWEGIPVFFSAPLSWPNALGNDAYARLKWHIRTVLRLEAEREMEAIIETKNRVVRNQKYEEAADLRSMEHLLGKRLEMLRF